MGRFELGRTVGLVTVCIMTGTLNLMGQVSPTAPGLPGDFQAQLEALRQQHQSNQSNTSDEDEVRSTQEDVSTESGETSEAPSFETWEELMQWWMTPMKVEKRSIVRVDETRAYMHPNIPVLMEIVKEDGDFVWLRGLPPEDPDSVLHRLWLRREVQETNRMLVKKYDEYLGPGAFLDFSVPVVPAPTISAVNFRSAGKGLPRGGKWQMGIDIADFNDDGIEDIVLPPPRLGTTPHPTIYLGNGKGDFEYWEAAKWNPGVRFDYGDVETGDFDQDGNLDIVIAIHFGSQYILYGSENGEFRRFVKLPSPDPRVTSRATTVADFNGDGRLDVAFLAELDLDQEKQQRLTETGTLWIVNNTERGWKLDPDVLSQFVIGDVLRAEDMDRDGRPDLVLGSNTSAWRAIVFFNRLEHRWSTLEERNVLGDSYHFGVAPFSSSSGDRSPVLYAVFEQFAQYRGERQARTGIVRYEPTTPDWSQIKYSVVFYDDQRFNPYFRIAVGDLNGDGIEDLAASRKRGGIEVWLQMEDGSFYLNSPDALPDPPGGRVYDLWVMDVDRDGFDDIVASVAQLDDGGEGGVRVWLSEPTS